MATAVKVPVGRSMPAWKLSLGDMLFVPHLGQMRRLSAVSPRGDEVYVMWDETQHGWLRLRASERVVVGLGR